MMTKKEEAMPVAAMPVIDAVIIAAIVAAFVVFGAVLAWAEIQTRHLPPFARQSSEPPKQKEEPTVIQATFRRDSNGA
jgi:hypothetical protein